MTAIEEINKVFQEKILQRHVFDKAIFSDNSRAYFHKFQLTSPLVMRVFEEHAVEDVAMVCGTILAEDYSRWSSDMCKEYVNWEHYWVTLVETAEGIHWESFDRFYI